MEQKSPPLAQENPVNTAEDAADYFLRTEEAFVLNGLRVGVEAFLMRLEARVELDAEFLSSEEITKVFQDYKTIYQFNLDMFKSLQDFRIKGKHELLYGMGKSLQQFIGFFGVYQNYIKNFKESSKFNEALQKGNSSYRTFCAVGEKCFNHKLEYYLKLPVKRLPQYLRLLAKIYDLIPVKGTEYANDLGASIFQIKKVTDVITQRIHDSDSRLLVYELNNEVFSGKLNLVTPQRYVVRHGELKRVMKKVKSGKNKTFKVILFNDMLLWGTQKAMFGLSGGSLEKVLPISGMTVEATETTGEFCEKNQFKVTAHNNETFVFSSKSNKTTMRWIEDIRDAVENEYHSLHPTNIVDLDKRVQNLKKFPPSAAGMAETVDQKDPKMLEEIKKWNDEKKDPEFKPLPLSDHIPHSGPPDISPPPVPSRPHIPPKPQSTRKPGVSAPPKPLRDAPPPPATSAPPNLAAPPPPGINAPPIPEAGGGGGMAAAGPPPPIDQAMAAPPPRSVPAASPTATSAPVATSRTGGGSMGGDLLAAIRQGANLKKTEPQKTDRARGGSRMQVLEEIRKRPQLRHVDVNAKKPEPLVEDTNDMASLLQKSLKNYRRFVVDEEDDDDDGDWN